MPITNDCENGVNYVLWKFVATVAEGLASTLSDINIWQEMYHRTDLGDKIVCYTSVIVESLLPEWLIVVSLNPRT